MNKCLNIERPQVKKPLARAHAKITDRMFAHVHLKGGEGPEHQACLDKVKEYVTAKKAELDNLTAIEKEASEFFGTNIVELVKLMNEEFLNEVAGDREYDEKLKADFETLMATNEKISSILGAFAPK